VAPRLATPERAIRLIDTESRLARGPSGRNVAATGVRPDGSRSFDATRWTPFVPFAGGWSGESLPAISCATAVAPSRPLCLSAAVLLPRSLLVTTVAITFGTGVVEIASPGAVAGAGTPQVSKSTVETQSAKILATETGQKLPKVTCPTGVAAKVGAVIHCTVVPYGMKVKYPATVTVRSISGSTANFYVQVGQALGQADRGKFCADNATINGALSAATTSAAFLSALRANESVILELQSTAPSKIVNAAGTLTQATRQAIQSGDIAVFNTKAVARAAIAVDKFCGQKS
jgi:hypothetical protein